MKDILILCTGNICRSPMAEALFLKNINNKNICVSSAGIHALVGNPADKLAQEVMHENGIDISAHRAKQITAEMLLKADLIFVMEQRQKLQIEFDLPVICGRVLRIGQWNGFDIPDPYRRTKKVFEQTFILLEECLKKWNPRLN